MKKIIFILLSIIFFSCSEQKNLSGLRTDTLNITPYASGKIFFKNNGKDSADLVFALDDSAKHKEFFLSKRIPLRKVHDSYMKNGFVKVVVFHDASKKTSKMIIEVLN